MPDLLKYLKMKESGELAQKRLDIRSQFGKKTRPGETKPWTAEFMRVPVRQFMVLTGYPSAAGRNWKRLYQRNRTKI